jgi:peptide/nickel transport system permease protein
VIAFLARRIVFAFTLVFLVSSAGLLLAGLAPGDVTSEMFAAGMSPETIARERERLGLDRPLVEQYAGWLGRAWRFDFGTSLRYQRPVRDLLAERAGNTVALGAAALVLASGLGLPLGVLAGSRRGWLPRVIGATSIAVLSVPPLISSLLLVLLAARTGWFPIGGLGLPGPHTGWLAGAASFAWHLTLPMLALALPFAATIERLQADATATELAQPHILAARARGVTEARLIWRHALKPALRPVVGIYGVIIGTLFSGSFAVEIVSSWPGLGSLMYEALRYRDIYLVAGCAAAGASFLAVGTLVSDLTLAALDPRLREASRRRW